MLHEGILVGADSNLEALLPWWWENYSKHNDHQVSFADFGMTNLGIKFCKQHGIYIPPFPIPPLNEIPKEMKKTWESHYKQIWNFDASTEFRSAFFKKPIACLNSPFAKTFWIDLDCKVDGDISPLFNLLSFGIEISALPIGAKENELLFNSGVVGFTQNAQVIQRWAALSKENHLFPGDQEALSKAIHTLSSPYIELPEIYNWSYLNGEHKNTVITHYHGNGKSQIMQCEL